MASVIQRRALFTLLIGAIAALAAAPAAASLPSTREFARASIGDGSEHTLEEMGQSFQVTRERIRQIEAKALRKLRHRRKLKAFLEGSRI